MKNNPNDIVALVTGANRGVGAAFVDDLLARGVGKVYATARVAQSINAVNVERLDLDITNLAQVAEVAHKAADVNLLINNAGVSTFAKATTGPIEDIRLEMETNYFGTLNLIRAFAPVLAQNGGGVILNVLSVMAWLGFEHSNSYGASKAALWGLSNGLRVELAAQGTQVSTLLMASTDTDMMAGIEVDKNDPADVARTAIDGVLAGNLEILADDIAVGLKGTLSNDPADNYPQAVRHI